MKNRRLNPPRLTVGQAAAGLTSGFTPIAEVCPRGRSGELLVRMYDDILHITSAFGRHLDAMNVTAFSLFANNATKQVALKVFIAGEEKTIGKHCEYEIVPLRPNGRNKNAGRRVNIRRALMSRPWLAEQMQVENEAQAYRTPVYVEAERLFVLNQM